MEQRPSIRGMYRGDPTAELVMRLPQKVVEWKDAQTEDFQLIELGVEFDQDEDLQTVSAGVEQLSEDMWHTIIEALIDRGVLDHHLRLTKPATLSITKPKTQLEQDGKKLRFVARCRFKIEEVPDDPTVPRFR